ncbi:MAG: hypothetical protein CUN53_11450 [Phototrophicales bacterium]|nr:MAG: hypothetical protein CUN53_11450 [Phototrophicales bacterium]
MRYAIVIEGSPGSYSAYAPDLPGCISVGETHDDVVRAMEEAIRFHLDGLHEDGLPIPEPTSLVEYIEL